MEGQGIGARLLRKEDDRYMRGRGQYVGDITLPGHAGGGVPAQPAGACAHQGASNSGSAATRVFIAEDLAGVARSVPTPRCRASSLRPAGRSPTGKVRYVGELVAMCVAPTRAEAEDIAAAIELDLDPLPAVPDMLAARKPGAPLVHEHWGDNLFLDHATTWTSRPSRPRPPLR